MQGECQQWQQRVPWAQMLPPIQQMGLRKLLRCLQQPLPTVSKPLLVQKMTVSYVTVQQQMWVAQQPRSRVL